jgi:hypothetical protein
MREEVTEQKPNAKHQTKTSTKNEECGTVTATFFGVTLWLLRILLVLSAMLESFALSFSYSSPDHYEMKRLAATAEMQRLDSGKLPFGWDDFKRTDIFESKVRVKERYAFLPVPVKIKERRGDGEIFLIARSPFEDLEIDKRSFLGIWMRVTYLTAPLRYALAAQSDGTVSVLTLPEAKVQQLFREQQIPLPEPDTLPEREWVKHQRRVMAAKKTAMMGLMLFGGYGAWMVFRRSAFWRSWRERTA